MCFEVELSMKVESGAVLVVVEVGCGGMWSSLSERLSGVCGGVLGVWPVLLVHCVFWRYLSRSRLWLLSEAEAEEECLHFEEELSMKKESGAVLVVVEVGCGGMWTSLTEHLSGVCGWGGVGCVGGCWVCGRCCWCIVFFCIVFLVYKWLIEEGTPEQRKNFRLLKNRRPLESALFLRGGGSLRTHRVNPK